MGMKQFFIIFLIPRAGEPAKLFSALAPDFFSKRLRLLFFSQAAPAPKEPKAPGSLALLFPILVANNSELNLSGWTIRRTFFCVFLVWCTFQELLILIVVVFDKIFLLFPSCERFL